MLEWQRRALYNTWMRPTRTNMETSEETILYPPGLRREERPMPHVLQKLLGSRRCGSALLPRVVPGTQPPSHGAAPAPSERKRRRLGTPPPPTRPGAEVTRAAAESLPAGWMRRSPSCRGGARVETDGAGEVRPASAVAALAGRTEGDTGAGGRGSRCGRAGAANPRRRPGG